MTGRPDAGRSTFLYVLVAVAGLVAGCSGGPILANEPVLRPSPAPTPAPPVAVSDPAPIVFPRDDGPHRRLTEWWYYTGHLQDRGGGRYGFEFVVFRAERGDFPVTWASHLAITDETGDRFLYGQRSEIGARVDASPRAGSDPTGFSFDVKGLDPTRPDTFANPAWTMSRVGDEDRLVAAFSAAEAAAAGAPGGLGLDLRLSTNRPPALHNRDGWIDFGPAGSSYYYSRTRMDATGGLFLDGRTLQVDGQAWFDHQWGDFISVGGGGWDWFAVNLDDGTDIALSRVRDASGGYPLVYGTLVKPDGSTSHLGPDAFTVNVTSHWRSSKTGAEYPAGWRIRLPSAGLDIELAPSVAAQELDTRETTGVVYWEGSQQVTATRDGVPLGGEAYVELTGYAPALATSSAVPSAP